jgi:DnaK suppressor protein
MTTKKSKVKRTKKAVVSTITYPMKLLRPVAHFLQSQLKSLEKRKKEISQEDPFKYFSRISDNASPDADAAEQFGHARVSAIGVQLDRKIIQTRRALSRIKLGKYGICENCGKMIDTDRLVIKPEATLCINCEKKQEKNN